MKIYTYSTHTELVMNHSIANVFNPSFFDDFNTCIANLNPNVNLIITGNGRFFSSGIDLFHINNFKRDEIIQFITRFESMLESVINRSGKTLAHINGHTVAGGFILSTACDKVYCTPGKYKLGMNEGKLGIKLPPLAQAIIQCTFADDMNKILCNDNFYMPEQMNKFGHFTTQEVLFNDVTKDEKRLKQIQIFMDTQKEKQMDLFLNSWFSEKSATARNEAIERLKKH